MNETLQTPQEALSGQLEQESLRYPRTLEEDA